MDITYQFTKKRSDFGHQPLFCEMGPEMCDSIATVVAEHKAYILRNPVHQETQNTPCFSENHINTIRAEYTNSGANHAEGGWPKDVNLNDPEATQRYRRKVEKEDGYIHCVMAIAPGMEHYIYQNNAIEMYNTYYSGMPEMPAPEHSSARTVNLYRDATQRTITSIAWQPDGGHHFTATYADIDFYRNPRGLLSANLWDLENANDALLTFSAPDTPIFDLQYSPRDPTVLIGGLGTGQVASWDTRKGHLPTVVSPLHQAHREMVRKVLFINSKSGMEFFSGGPDGCCKWWDLRNMSQPTDEMIMDLVRMSTDIQSMATAHPISVMEYEPTIPTRFMVGTDDGLVIAGNRKGKTPLEKLPVKYDAHVGPLVSLQRNPSFLKVFLTAGEWRTRIWSEDCRESAILWTSAMRHGVTAAQWAPARCSLLLIASSNGVLQFWDLLRRQHEPVMTMQVCYVPITVISYHEGGSLVAIGNKKGCVTMVELSHNLTQSDKNDKGFMLNILERESKREKILEARLREIRLKMRQAEEKSPAASLSDMDATIGDRDLIEAANDYAQQVKKELTLM